MVQQRISLMILMSVLFCTLMIPSVLAEDTLELTQVRIFVDGTRATNIDEEGGDTVDDDVYPGSTVKVKLTLENTYSDDEDEDIEIEDIKVEGTLVDVDLGADVEDELDEFDLDAEQDKEVTLTFDIPDEVQQDTYRLEIEIEGEDDLGNKLEIDKEYFIKVQKREHDVRVVDVSLKDPIIQCGEETIVSVTVQNFGREDEHRARIKVENSEIPLNYASMFYLDSKVSADNNKYTREYPIQIPKDFEPGKLDIIVTSHYQKTIQTDSSLAILEVQCSPEAVAVVEEKEEEPAPTNNEPKEESPTTSTTTQNQPTQVAPSVPVNQAPTQAEPVAQEEEGATQVTEDSFLEKNKWLFLIVFVNLLVLLIGVGVIFIMTRPRKASPAPKGPVKNHFLDQLHSEQKKNAQAHQKKAQAQQPQSAPVTQAALDAQKKPKKPFTFSYYDMKE